MVVVLPEPLTPTTRMTNGRAVISSGLATGASTFSISPARTAFTSSGAMPLSKRPSPAPRRCARRNPAPDRRGSIRLPVLERAASSLRFDTRSAMARAERRRGALEPAAQAFPPASALVCCRSCASVRARDSRFVMTPEEMLARLLYRDGLMLVIDKPAGLAVHRGPKGGDEPGGLFRRAALRPAARAGAGAPARQGHLRLPGARPPPQGAGAARQAVQAGQDRQDLLGGGRRRPGRRRRPHRHCRSASSTRPAAGG